jgi:lysyl-tRNA synthetase class 1
MYLDEKGKKISKSKGNGITIKERLNYASPESLSLYMYQKPKTAKKLYANVVPKAVDEYLTSMDKFSEQDDKQKILNPVWHVHNGNPPKEKSIMPFSILLNLVGTSNATDKDILWKFIKKNKKNIKVSDHPILDSLVGYALKYFEDVVKPNKKFRKANEKEKKALKDLVKRLESCKDQTDPEAIQTIVYSVGKDNGYAENLREWFKAIYEIIFGDQDGPRMGFFISFFGIKESIELINKHIK